jgi:hypothetical protein
LDKILNALNYWQEEKAHSFVLEDNLADVFEAQLGQLVQEKDVESQQHHQHCLHFAVRRNYWVQLSVNVFQESPNLSQLV